MQPKNTFYPPGVFNPKMSKDDFARLSAYVTENYGIKLPEQKKLMLEGRLRKRLVQLKMQTYAEYCEYLFSDAGGATEAQEMIDLVSTNKTDFFREPEHFRYLQEKVLPQYKLEGVGTRYNSLKVWSAGCSTGEEPYTLAIVMSEFAAANSGLDFSIFASDISAAVLKKAHMAIYPESKITPIAISLRKKYLMRGKGSDSDKVRFVPEIRRKISFKNINLMNLHGVGEAKFHIIFCRNVIIYFDRQTQEELIEKFYYQLLPGGYMFLGHSEALPGLRVPFKAVAPMVYRKF